MSQTNTQSYEGNLIQIKHPWQPEWVRTREDVALFLQIMENYLYLAKDERDWYPPFIVFPKQDNIKLKVINYEVLQISS